MLFFPPNLGAPEKIRLANLESWTANSDDGVKYFSGTATYTKTMQVPKDWLKSGARVVLDLGNVKDIAQVLVNGRAGGDLMEAAIPGRYHRPPESSERTGWK